MTHTLVKFSLLVLVSTLSVVPLSNGEVTVVDSSTELNQLIKSSSLTNPLVVRFFSSRDSKASILNSAFKKISSSQILPVKWAEVDIDARLSDILETQGLKPKSLPTFKFFVGPKKSFTLPDKLDGKADEIASSVMSWVFELAQKVTFENLGLKYEKKEKRSSSSKGSGTVELTEANFKAKVIDVASDAVALVEFFAPWCGHCKQLAPIYEQVAKTVHGDPEKYGENTIVAAVDATVHQSLAQTYGIQGFPTIKLFVGGKLKSDYNGPRDAATIQDFIKSNLPPKRVESTLKQLTSIEADFEDQCMKAPLCVLAFLPNLYDCDSKCRNKYIKMLQNEASAEDGTGSGRGWTFLWTEGASSEEAIKFEESLGVGPGLGYPNLVLINGRKEKYAPFKGSFSPSGLKEFLKAIIYGAKGASPLYPLPNLSKLTQTLKNSGQGDIPAWDGKDAPPLEEPKDEL